MCSLSCWGLLDKECDQHPPRDKNYQNGPSSIDRSSSVSLGEEAVSLTVNEDLYCGMQ